MKTKPFDLEAAKNGAKVVTRDGCDVPVLHQLDFVTDGYPLVAVVSGVIQRYTIDGRYFKDCKNSNYDLFLAVETKTMYVNLYHERGTTFTAYSFPSEELALANAGNGACAVAQKIEVEQS